MPSAPILARTLLWETLSDGTVHQLDWNLVETNLGTMVEPRIMSRRSQDDMRHENLSDAGYTGIAKMSTADLYANYHFFGVQWPIFRGDDLWPLL